MAQSGIRQSTVISKCPGDRASNDPRTERPKRKADARVRDQRRRWCALHHKAAFSKPDQVG